MGAVAGRLSGPVAILDRPGWGASEPAPVRAGAFRAAQSSWLREALDGLGFDVVTLVGASIGAYVCLAASLDVPTRVAGLVTVGAPAGVERKFPFFLRLMGNSVTGPLLARMKITDPEVNRKRVFANLVAHPSCCRSMFSRMTSTRCHSLMPDGTATR